MFTEAELKLIAEAIDARLETGMFEESEDEPNDIVYCSPSHERALEALQVKIANIPVEQTPKEQEQQ